jgi:excisionase family DNA binding protein
MEQLFMSGIKVDELLAKIEQLLDAKIGNQPQEAKEPQSHYITRKEAAQLLRVSLPTLHDWTKQGWVESYKIASRVFYRRLEIEEALKSAETYKNKRGV